MIRKYKDLVNGIKSGLIDIKELAVVVANSDDRGVYVYHNGKFCNIADIDNKALCLETLYADCDINNIQLINVEVLHDTTVPEDEEDIYESENKEDTEAYKMATNYIIALLEDKYADLDMEIDNCQGCMDNLDEAFAKLDIYKKLVKFLGGDIDKDYKKIIDKWYDKRREEDEKIEAKKKADEEIIKNLNLDIFSIFTINSQVGFELSKIQTKINEMCSIIRDLKRNKF